MRRDRPGLIPARYHLTGSGQPEGLMRGCNIVDLYYQFILFQCPLTRAQQEAVAHLPAPQEGADPPPPEECMEQGQEAICAALPWLLANMKQLRPSRRTSGSGGNMFVA